MFPTSFSHCPCLLSKVHSDVLWQTGRVWTSRPAKEGGRSGRRRVMPMWCIYVCPCESCSAAMFFTCTLVRSCPDSNERVKCETWSVGTNSKIYWVGQGKQGIYLRRRTNRRLSLSLDRGHEGRIREVLQEESCSSIFKLSLCVLAYMITTSSCNMYHNYFMSRGWFMILIVVYFL
jgi:hypothetical protein